MKHSSNYLVTLLCLFIICSSLSACSDSGTSSEADNEIAELKNELETCTEELEQCQNELLDIKEKNTSMSDELESNIITINELNDTIHSLSEECISFKNEIESLAEYLSQSELDIPVFISKDNIKIPDEHKTLIQEEFSSYEETIKASEKTNSDYPIVLLLLEAELMQYSAETGEYTYELRYLYSVSEKNIDGSMYYGLWDGIRGDYIVIIEKIDGAWISSVELGE